jgi:Ser/Thr protein kinase RdoA (MazF antagonist)
MLEPGDAERLALTFGLDGEARLEGPVDRGEQGQVWRLDVRGGRYAVKETFAPLEDEQAQLAHAFQLSAAAAAVRAPEAVPARGGEVLVRLGAEALRLYRWVEMARPERAISPEQVGRCLAGLHRSGPRLETRTDPWYFEPVGRARWEDLTRRLDQQGAPFVARLAGLVDQLVATESFFVEPTAPILCHRDLSADNVRATPDGDLVVIDWDNCGAASADSELGMVLLEFGLDEDRVARLYRSYRLAGGPGRVTSISDLTMPAAMVGHIGELGCRQWLEASDEAARSRAAGRVEEFLAEPWTLEVLERLVGLVGAVDT